MRRLTRITYILATGALALMLASAASCGTVYVWCGSPGTPDGASWNTAYHTISEGIGAAQSGDQVRVSGGCTYNERITLKDGVALYGGFPTGGGSWAQRNAAAHPTVIDGEQLGSVVTVPAGATAATIIDGFTIQNGKAATGGGVNCGAGAVPVISGNVIRANTATNYGGGIYGGGTISGNVIAENSSTNSGGGIMCHTVDAIVTGNTISDNRSQWGGGIRFHNSTGEITRNRFLRNTGTSGAGGVNLNSSSPLVASNLFVANTTGLTAGGLDLSNSSSLVTNNTLVNNSAAQGGGIALRGTTGAPTICNNIVAFNITGVFRNSTSPSPPVLRCNDVYQNSGYDYSGVGSGVNSISEDPAFVDAANGNYRLTSASPCRDRGDGTVVQAGWLDIDGEMRVFPPSVDIGADEVHDLAAIPDAKLQPASAWITAVDLVVTAAWPGCFYVQTLDRTAGIRVEMADHGVAVGDRVIVSGRMATTPGMERRIDGTAVLRVGAADAAPLGLVNRHVGGGNWGENPVSGSGQAGVEGSCGLNNVGLLVKTWGVVTGRGRDWLYIDDGSGVSDGTPYTGIYVNAGGLTVPALGAWVSVTGISRCESFGGSVVNLLTPRTNADISVVAPPPPGVESTMAPSDANPRDR